MSENNNSSQNLLIVGGIVAAAVAAWKFLGGGSSGALGGGGGGLMSRVVGGGTGAGAAAGAAAGGGGATGAGASGSRATDDRGNNVIPFVRSEVGSTRQILAEITPQVTDDDVTEAEVVEGDDGQTVGVKFDTESASPHAEQHVTRAADIGDGRIITDPETTTPIAEDRSEAVAGAQQEGRPFLF